MRIYLIIYRGEELEDEDETCIKKDQVKFIQAPKKIQAIENNTSRIQVQYKYI